MPLDDKWLFHKSHSTPKFWNVSSKVTVILVGTLSKIWTVWLNRTKVYNREQLDDALELRSHDKGLLTVCNHHSCLDDPLLWGILKRKHLHNGDLMRWTPGADDVCFTKYLHALFFSLGKTVPIIRGEGVYQRSMDFLLEQLNKGKWVHFFPEGKVNLGKEDLRLKWGVGRLISDCKKIPLVLPFWHFGMDDILPNRSPYIPKIMKHVTVLIGEPLDFREDLVVLQQLKKSPREIRKHITDRIQEEFLVLKKRAEALHYSKELTESS
ncbi:hypothetical protein ScPMuIL_007568 [Solemya velum]